MKRREFITVVGGTVIAWPLAARAQQPAKAARIGHLDLGPASARASRVEALRAGLRDLGWVEGKNIVIEFRWADTVQQLPELAAERGSWKLPAALRDWFGGVGPFTRGKPAPRLSRKRRRTCRRRASGSPS